MLTRARRDAILSRMVKLAALDRTFAAISDPTRRRILDRLAAGPASISDLAEPLGLSLPGTLKHVRILEGADLVATTKRGRTRECALGPGHLNEAKALIELYEQRWNRRLDRLERYLDKRKEVKR